MYQDLMSKDMFSEKKKKIKKSVIKAQEDGQLQIWAPGYLI
jgi:hypothetical protein